MALAPHNVVSTPDATVIVVPTDTEHGERMYLEVEEKETRAAASCLLNREQMLQLMGCLVLLCRELGWECEG